MNVSEQQLFEVIGRLYVMDSIHESQVKLLAEQVRLLQVELSKPKKVKRGR